MFRSAALVCSGLVLGLGLGYVWFAEGEGKGKADHVAVADDVNDHVDDDVNVDVDVDVDADVNGDGDGLDASTRVLDASQQVVSAEQRALELEQRVQGLERQLEAIRDAGTPERARVLPPKGIDSRFVDQRQLHAAVWQGLKEMGLADADVTAIDCSEFPCILIGTGLPDFDAMEQLKQTRAFSAYAKDGAMLSMQFIKGEDGGRQRAFALSLFPVELREQLGDPVRDRFWSLWNTER